MGISYIIISVLNSVILSPGGGGASAAISLEHFFLSLKQYYLELKKEGGARATPTGSPITPLELEGLRGVLGLIRVIAKHVSTSV